MHEAMISHSVKHLKSTSNNCWISCSSRHWPASCWHLLALPQAMGMAGVPMLCMFFPPRRAVIDNSALPLISIETSTHFNSKHCMLAHTERFFVLCPPLVHNFYAILKHSTGQIPHGHLSPSPPSSYPI